MSEAVSKQKKNFKWQLECVVHSVVERCVGWLPGSWVYRLGEWIAVVMWHGIPHRRKVALRNLRIALAGEYSLAEIKALAKQSFRLTGGNLVSAARTAQLSPEALRDVVRIVNLERLECELAKGRGVVLLLSHMGNWELLSRLVHLFPEGSQTGAFYRPLNNVLMDQRILERRQADGTRMFSKRDPFHRATGFLREGGIVGVLADHRVGQQGVLMPFFGRLARVSPLPSLLARRAKASVLAMSMKTTEAGTWEVCFHEVAEPHHTVHCMQALEKAMKESVLDVFWLHERWRMRLRGDASLTERLGEAPPLAEKRFRMVLWLTGVGEDWEFPERWQHAAVDYECVLETQQAMPRSLAAMHCPRHDVGEGMSAKAYGKVLERLEESAALPIDVILVPKAPRCLKKAAQHAAIPVAEL